MTRVNRKRSIKKASACSVSETKLSLQCEGNPNEKKIVDNDVDVGSQRYGVNLSSSAPTQRKHGRWKRRHLEQEAFENEEGAVTGNLSGGEALWGPKRRHARAQTGVFDVGR